MSIRTGRNRSIPVEIARVYMVKHTGNLHETRIDDIGRGLRRAIAAHTPQGR